MNEKLKVFDSASEESDSDFLGKILLFVRWYLWKPIRNSWKLHFHCNKSRFYKLKPKLYWQGLRRKLGNEFPISIIVPSQECSTKIKDFLFNSCVEYTKTTNIYVTVIDRDVILLFWRFTGSFVLLNVWMYQ